MKRVVQYRDIPVMRLVSLSVSVVQKRPLLKLATVTSVTSNSCAIVHLSGCFVNYNLLDTV